MTKRRGKEITPIALATTIAREPQLEVLLNARRLELSLHDYVRAAWPLIEPATPFIDSPHIGVICAHLQKMTETQEWLRTLSNDEVDALDDPALFRDLVITIPPGMSKSTICSVMWPTWVWARSPSERFLTASYSGDLSERDALKSRRLVESDWYQARWGHRVQLSLDQNAKDRYENTATGYRIAMSVGGATTGERGSVIIIDDPHNVKQTTHSEPARMEVLSWWDEAMGSRLNDERRDLRVIIQQRVHEDDLAGHVVAQGDWVHLNLPMEYEGEKNPTPLPWEDWRTADGELLAPDREGPAQVAKRKVRMGMYAYAAQYQQRPVPRGGAIFREETWHRYRREDLPERFRRVIVTADTAQKKGKTNDYTVFALWAEGRERWYLLDLVWQRMTYPELENMAREMWAFWTGPEIPRGWRPHRFIVEDASSGSSLIQTLELETRLPIEAYKLGDGDKQARAHAISGYQNTHRLSLPATSTDSIRAIDVARFIHEHSMFPNMQHDDAVDTTCMALLWFTRNKPVNDIGDAALAVGVVRKSWVKK